MRLEAADVEAGSTLARSSRSPASSTRVRFIRSAGEAPRPTIVQVPRRRPEERPAEAEIDLHGLPPDKALRKLERALHSARVRRQKSILVITGRGLGNETRTPVLRPKVEAFLRTRAGERLGVVSFELASRGGALFVSLRVDGTARETDEENEWTD